MFRRFVCMLLVLAMLTSMAPLSIFAEEAGEETALTDPQPIETEPVVTEPVVTEPAPTEPVVTEPPVTEPAVTEPAVTEPPVTEPVVTEPEPTEPTVTEPAAEDPTEQNDFADVCIEKAIIAGHNMIKDEMLSKKRSCYDVGYDVMVCTDDNCSFMCKTNVIPSRHDFPNSTYAQVNSDGDTDYCCSACGVILFTSNKNCPHASFHTSVWEATCEGSEYLVKTCEENDCGFIKTAVGAPALEHKWGAWEVVVDATTTSEGEKIRECSLCGLNDSCIIPRLSGAISQLEPIHYLAFSNLAYRNWMKGELRSNANGYLNKVWNKTGVIENSQITGEMLYRDISNWRVVCTSWDWNSNKDGFYAVTFQGQTTDGVTRTVIAYRGSMGFADMDGLFSFPWDYYDDWYFNDLPFQVNHTYTGQLQDAIDYYNYCVKKLNLSADKTVLTGHSLGGALAAVVSMVYGVHAEIFNGASVFNALYYNKPVMAGRLFHGIDRWNITAHVIDGDILVGQWDGDYKYLPHIVYQRSSQSTSSGVSKCHGLGNFVFVENGQVKMVSHSARSQRNAVYDSLNPRLMLGRSGGDYIEGLSTMINKRATIFGGDGSDIIIREGWVNDEIVGGTVDSGWHKVIDGGRGSDTYYYFNGNGEHWIYDSEGSDTLRLLGFPSGTNIDFVSDYRKDLDGISLGAVLCNGKPIIYISMNHSGTFDIEVCDDSGTVKQSIRILGFVWDKISTSLCVACPTTVEILDAGGNIVQVLENDSHETVRTNYGNFYTLFDESGESVKYFDIIEGYTFRIRGAGEGSMSIMYQHDESDVYSVENAPVTTEMTARITEDEKPLLVIDSDSDGTADLIMSMAGELEADCVTIEQDYLAMKPNESAQLIFKSQYETLKDIVSWSTANADESDSEPIVSVDASGNVTALRAGTAYVTVSVSIDGITYSDRCRIDVVDGEGEHPIAENVTEYGADLQTAAAKVSLFSTNYTRIPVVLNLKQNMPAVVSKGGSAVIPQQTPENIGAAIESAAFANAAVAQLFDLRVADDRTLEIVPKNSTLLQGESNPASVLASYKSAIVLTVDSQQVRTGDLTFTVDKKLPTVRAAALKINSFFPDAVPLTFTGIKVTQVEPNGELPAGFVLDADAMTVTYTGTAPSAAARLNLWAVPEGWAVRVPVVVSVTAARTEPTVKLSASSVTLLPNSKDAASVTMTVTPACAVQPELTLLNASGAQCEDISVSFSDGVITLSPTAAAPYGASYKLNVKLPGATRVTVLTVKTLAAKAVPALSVKAAGAIDTAIPNSPITLTAAIKNFHAGSGEAYNVTIQRAGGTPKTTENVTGLFHIQIQGSTVTLTEAEPGTLEKGYTYTAKIQADVTGDGSFDCEATAKLSVKWSLPSKVPVSVSLKATGSIDVIRPGTSIRLVPTVKNWFGFEPQESDLVFYTGSGKTMQAIEGEAPFTVTVENGAYILTSNGADSAVKYSVGFSADVKGDGSTYTAKPVSLSVKMGAAKLTADTKAVTLLKKDRYDTAAFEISTTDSALSQIAQVRLDSASAALLELKSLGNGQYTLGYLNSQARDLGRGVTAKIEVFLEGNHTAKPNATLTIKVTAQ